MKIIACKDYEEMSSIAAELIAAQVHFEPHSVLGLATGSTPKGPYRELAGMVKRGQLSFADATAFNLDEYIGLGAAHDQSYAYFMEENFYKYVDLPAERRFIPSGVAADMATECAEYDKKLESYGGISLQLLGIGVNGHIGFNEPADALSSGTHTVELAAETIEANARFFASAAEVPTRAVTMGMGAIIKAGKVLLMASGEKKAEAVYKMLAGPVTPQLPASFLQLHPQVVVLADEAALSLVRANAPQLIG